MNLTISLLLLVASIANTLASVLLFRIMNEFFKGAMAEERRQLRIVFGIFSGTVLVIMILSFVIGKLGTIVKNTTVRISLEYMFAAIADFPCIFVILYFHYINYRPETLSRRSARISKRSKGTQSSKSNKSIQIDEDLLVTKALLQDSDKSLESNTQEPRKSSQKSKKTLTSSELTFEEIVEEA